VATYQAVAAIGYAILRLLEDACPRADFPDARFDFLPLAENAKPIADGITLHLYRVAANTARRHLPSRPRPDGKKFRPTLNLDLYYLVIPWAPTADKQHHLLGWAMRVLEDTPILPAGLLNSFFVPKIEIFHPEETVELIFEPLSLADLGVVWDHVRPKIGLSATYVARLVSIESSVETIEAREVQTREFDMTKAPTP
jgi:hypothetical protein